MQEKYREKDSRRSLIRRKGKKIGKEGREKKRAGVGSARKELDEKNKKRKEKNFGEGG